MPKSIYLRLLPLTLVWLLSACVSTPPEPVGPAVSWSAHVQQLNDLSRFQARGTFAYLTPQRRQSARFFLQQKDAEHYQLLLLNPLGGTVLEISAAPGNITLKDNDGKTYQGVNADELVYRLTGMQIPVTNLRHWILGLPGDNDTYTLAGQRLATLQHVTPDGTWIMRYNSYDVNSNPVLPAAMELTQGDQRIKLKIDDWIL
ncbi:lipoprotein insertase outer membrane protein LolB [Plesiomonas shigelloides]|uniref:lipoprotein insertase outer membrane protein LolB n=1 Tax=Plesiomonas shigelloides TaxID=703 RepID=UPI00387F09F3